MFAIGAGYTLKVCPVVQGAEVKMLWNVDVEDDIMLAPTTIGLDHVADRHFWLKRVFLSCLRSVFPGHGKFVGSCLLGAAVHSASSQAMRSPMGTASSSNTRHASPTFRCVSTSMPAMAAMRC